MLTAPVVSSTSAAASLMSEQGLLDLLQQADARLQACGSGQDVDFSADNTFLPTVKQFLLNPKDFAAGNLRNHLPVWQQLFGIFGHTSKTDSRLDWIKHGDSLEFVHPQSEEQTEHSRFGKRIQLVNRLKSVWQKLWGQSMCCHTLIVNILMNCLHQVRCFLVSVCADPAFSMTWELSSITRQAASHFRL